MFRDRSLKRRNVDAALGLYPPCLVNHPPYVCLRRVFPRCLPRSLGDATKIEAHYVGQESKARNTEVCLRARLGCRVNESTDIEASPFFERLRLPIGGSRTGWACAAKNKHERDPARSVFRERLILSAAGLLKVSALKYFAGGKGPKIFSIPGQLGGMCAVRKRNKNASYFSLLYTLLPKRFTMQLSRVERSPTVLERNGTTATVLLFPAAKVRGRYRGPK